MLQWPPHRSVDDSLEFIHHARELWQRGSAWLAGIFDHEREQLIGCTGLNVIDRVNRRAEVGTWIGLPFQGAGYYRPARGAIATFAFRELDVARLEMLVRVDNERSLRAARSLPKIREEGVLAQRISSGGDLHDAVLFALLADEFDPADWPDVTIDPEPT